jgi:L-malate glycosyltransferase
VDRSSLSPAPIRILYICHSGELYGSQESLRLLLAHLPPTIAPVVSVARQGPLQERLQALPNIVAITTHQRLQWVKHDARNVLQRIGDVLSLLGGAVPRVNRLVHLIKQHHIQLVHTNSLVSLEGALAAWVCGVPHVWHIRELFMLPNPKLHMVLGRWLTKRLVLALSKRVVCISDAVAGQFKGASLVRRIYNATE